MTDKIGERIATRFHEIYERLAPDYGYETRKDTREFDPDSANGKLMVAVCNEVMQPLLDDKERLTAEVERLNTEVRQLDQQRISLVNEAKARIAQLT
jgi:hypothetical protein